MKSIFTADYGDMLLGLKLQTRSIRRMLQRKQQIGSTKGQCPLSYLLRNIEYIVIAINLDLTSISKLSKLNYSYKTPIGSKITIHLDFCKLSKICKVMYVFLYIK